MMPKKPVIVKQERLFRSVLKDKIANTFNDKNRMLFRHMLAIIDFEGDKDSDKNYRYGTYHFEYIWEKMIDKVFGVENKADYFPKTTWCVNGSKYDNASLEPDTIMLYGTDAVSYTHLDVYKRQPFSMMGQQKGFEDARGTLFFRIAEIVDDKIKKGKKPKAIILENVQIGRAHV